MASRRPIIHAFDLQPGHRIGSAYEVESRLGAGWQGEVYRVVERRTGATRAAKLFYPHRNEGDRAVDFSARTLERLRDCPMIIKYHHAETVQHGEHRVTALISEYVDGILLARFVASQRGGRLGEFEALHVLRTLAVGLAQIHARRAYHGDLHDRNVLVRREGVHFRVKLVDLFDQGRPSVARVHDDIIGCVRLFYDMLGGQRWYARQRGEVRWIIGGLKHSLITKRFPTAQRLVDHLDSFEWSAP